MAIEAVGQVTGIGSCREEKNPSEQWLPSFFLAREAAAEGCSAYGQAQGLGRYSVCQGFHYREVSEPLRPEEASRSHRPIYLHCAPKVSTEGKHAGFPSLSFPSFPSSYNSLPAASPTFQSGPGHCYLLCQGCSFPATSMPKPLRSPSQQGPPCPTDTSCHIALDPSFLSRLLPVTSRLIENWLTYGI